MATKIKTYPAISFVETDVTQLINALIQSYEKFTGRKLYPADPVRLFLLWLADIIIQERVNIDFAAKQNLPRYAEGEYLDSLAEIFRDTSRLPTEPARTTLRFTLSLALETAAIIPAGTRATVDGAIVFATLVDLTIPPGELTGEVAAVCLTAGENGNGFLPGQINQLVDIFPYFERVENVTASAGGADEENDAAFYQRLRESWETYSTAGSLGAYAYYAKSASALIEDVQASSPAPGQVDVRVLLQGGVLPGAEILAQVREILTADKVRPLTDQVTVAAPEAVAYDIDLTYFTQAGSAWSDEAVAAQVEAAVAQFQRWQAARMGRDINPSYLISLLMQTGVKRVEVIRPAFATVAAHQVAQIGQVRIVNGGGESE